MLRISMSKTGYMRAQMGHTTYTQTSGVWVPHSNTCVVDDGEEVHLLAKAQQMVLEQGYEAFSMPTQNFPLVLKLSNATKHPTVNGKYTFARMHNGLPMYQLGSHCIAFQKDIFVGTDASPQEGWVIGPETPSRNKDKYVTLDTLTNPRGLRWKVAQTMADAPLVIA